MRTIRSFIAIPLGDEVSRNAVRLLKRVSASGDGIKWVPADNLHLTLKFLGDVDNTQVPSVCAVIRNICQQYDPFQLRLAGAGGFPNPQRPRILYAGVEDSSGALTEIVTQLEKDLAKIGFKPEPRDYTPHLTLGRTRGGSRRASEEVIARVMSESDTELGTMLVDCVQLFASFLDKQGPTYQIMDTIELGQ
ncbi:MAG: RNA 2',3'-cyclic phosphodiesterase [Rubripirellula sp.]